MTIGERIKVIRKGAKMNLDEFGAKIGVTGPAVSMMENGKASVTDRSIKAICREFHVNETWLRTGAGEMSAKSYEDELEKMCAERGLSHADYVAIRKIMEMPKAAREAVTAFMIDFAAEVAPAPAPAPRKTREQEAEVAAKVYAAALDGGEKASESGTPPAGAGIA